MNLRSLTDAQLERLYRKAYDRLRYASGTGSWDWPTLRLVYPGWYATLWAIYAEIKERLVDEQFQAQKV